MGGGGDKKKKAKQKQGKDGMKSRNQQQQLRTMAANYSRQSAAERAAGFEKSLSSGDNSEWGESCPMHKMLSVQS